MKVKVCKEFLGVPVGSIGEITGSPNTLGRDGKYRNAVYIQFPCKTEPVLIQYPGDSYYQDLEEENANPGN